MDGKRETFEVMYEDLDDALEVSENDDTTVVRKIRSKVNIQALTRMLMQLLKTMKINL